MTLIQDTGLEATLPEMPSLNVSSVEVERKRAVNPLKRSTKRSVRSRHSNMVDVVIHQAVCPDSNFLGRTIFDEQLHVDNAVCVVQEHCRFTVASLCQVISKIRDEIPKAPSSPWQK
jgi:hypothetical protein